jgi:hypothetical protein
MEILFNDVLRIHLVVSYLISFPLMRGEGKDGGGRPGLFPLPPESSPTVGGGRSYFSAQLGLYLNGSKSESRNPCLRRSGFAWAGETRNNLK